MINRSGKWGLVAIAVAITACSAGETEPPKDGPGEETGGVAAPIPEVRVQEAYRTAPADPAANLDSMAFWRLEDGEVWMLVTAKEGHQLHVYDAATGQLLRTVSAPGPEPGQLQRPNGIAIVDDLAFVVERDNHRVQVFSLPEFESLAVIGAESLRRPYGIAMFRSADPTIGGNPLYELYITDNYETPDEEIPPVAELGERVKHFRVMLTPDGVESEFVSTFGDTAGPGILHKVETIMVDAALDRVIVADELPEENRFKVYDLSGQYTGEQFGMGHIFGEPEGAALATCGEVGYWVVTDQHDDLSRYQVFARDSLDFVGAFAGTDTGKTDGVALWMLPIGSFTAGLFVGSHQDEAVSAFAWADIVAALQLDPNCLAN